MYYGAAVRLSSEELGQDVGASQIQAIFIPTQTVQRHNIQNCSCELYPFFVGARGVHVLKRGRERISSKISIQFKLLIDLTEPQLILPQVITWSSWTSIVATRHIILGVVWLEDMGGG